MEKILELLKYSSKTATLVISRPIKAGIRKIKKGLHFQSKIKKFANETSKKVKGFLSGKPKSKEDYVKIGNKYYSRQIAAIMIVLFVVLPIMFLHYGIPAMKGWIWESSFTINSKEMENFSGKAKVYSSDNKLIYRGRLSDGRITGYGTLFNKDGGIIYKGNFENEEYSGYGEQYDGNNILMYKGEFERNRYSGYGELFNNQKTIYRGDFLSGAYNGKGKLFWENGKIKYNGDFANGKPEGKGIFYDDNGRILYSGEAIDGKYAGEGTKYFSNGNINYEGGFNNGLFNGEGKLYNRFGRLEYEGGFVNGKFEGIGTAYYASGKVKYIGSYFQGQFTGNGILYNEENGKKIYDGEFGFGKFDGLGKKYNHSGRLIYEGDFKYGYFHGIGTLYSDNGAKLYSGSFFENEIDYSSFLGIEITKLREAFGEEDEFFMLNFGFVILYRDLGVLVYGNYVDEFNVPVVNRINLVKNQDIKGIRRKMNTNSLEKELGSDFRKLSVIINDENTLYLRLIKEIDSTLDTGSTSILEYTFDGYKIRYYINDMTKEILFYQFLEV